LSAVFVAVVVILVFLVPLFASFFPSLFIGDTLPLTKQSEASFYKIIKITFFTLKIALGSTLVAVMIGVPAAFFCAKRNFLFKKILKGMSAVPLCIPVLIASLGFVSVFGLSGSLNKLLELAGFSKTRLLYSQWGIMIAQGFYNFPLVMSIVSRFWENLPVENENAARLLGAGEGRIFFKITFPALLPGLASSVIPVFLFCFFSFMMVLLFSAPGTSTLEVEIYHSIKTSLDTAYASRLALSETVTALIIVFLYSFFMGKDKISGDSFNIKNPPKLCQGAFETPVSRICEGTLFVILSFLILFFFVMPFFGIAVSGFTARIKGRDVFSFNQYRTLFKSTGFFESLETTLIVSSATGFLCVVTALVFSFLSIFLKNKIRRILEAVVILPMAVSSVVLGFGITLLVKRGNALSLVLVQTALFWPLAYRQILVALNRIPADVKSAAFLLSSGRVEAVFRVFIPWIRKSLLASFGFCFAFSAGDTTLPLVLSIPKFQTLSLYTYRLSGSYRFNTACASGTILALICFIVFVVSEKIGEGVRK